MWTPLPKYPYTKFDENWVIAFSLEKQRFTFLVDEQTDIHTCVQRVWHWKCKWSSQHILGFLFTWDNQNMCMTTKNNVEVIQWTTKNLHLKATSLACSFYQTWHSQQIVWCIELFFINWPLLVFHFIGHKKLFKLWQITDN